MRSHALEVFLDYRQRVALSLFSAETYFILVEVAFFSLIVYLALTRAYKPRASAEDAGPSAAERAARLASWKPKPLAVPLPSEVTAALPADISLASSAGPRVRTTAGDDLLNLSSANFLGLANDARVTERAQAALRGYGCGACGPRGFYGTTDVHLRCEDAIASFSGTDGAILYSFGAATASSTVPAFCKRGDVIVADAAIHFGLQTGLTLSRAVTRQFRHNDMGHLEAVMKDVVAEDAKRKNRSHLEKRFVMAEGVYANAGDIAPLRELVRLKKKYRFRLILDESFSVGVLGASGRGSLERFGVPREDVDIAIADLGNAFGSVGGYCVGDAEVVSHQRLSGAGYCFSASQPPFLAAAATTALGIVVGEGDSLAGKLRSNVIVFQEALNARLPKRWVVHGHAESPLMHIRSVDERLSGEVFAKMQRECIERGMLVAVPMYVPQEENRPRPSLRVTVMATHEPEQLREAAAVIAEVLERHTDAR